jgi:hypothetical protein
MVLLEKGLDVEREGKLDRLAGGPGWRDDDDTAGRGLAREECIVIGRQVPVLNGSNHDRVRCCKEDAASGITPWRRQRA